MNHPLPQRAASSGCRVLNAFRHQRMNHGIQWNSSCDHPVIDGYTTRGGGGHALAFISLSERLDKSGQHYLWLANSWGTNWGNKGWAEVSPTAVTQMLSIRSNVMIGLSDMPAIKPREFSLADLKTSLRI